jgi:hypothetical protein
VKHLKLSILASSDFQEKELKNLHMVLSFGSKQDELLRLLMYVMDLLFYRGIEKYATDLRLPLLVINHMDPF